MLNPSVCWVANVRTIWSHLVIKHGGDLDRANEELGLYRDHDEDSEMAYQKWAAIHRELGASMSVLNGIGTTCAVEQDVAPGKIAFIWADAVANALYAQQHKD